MSYRKVSYIDMLVYRFFYWWWNPILKDRPVYRELLISWLKAYDVLNEGERIIVKIEKVSK